MRVVGFLNIKMAQLLNNKKSGELKSVLKNDKNPKLLFLKTEKISFYQYLSPNIQIIQLWLLLKNCFMTIVNPPNNCSIIRHQTGLRGRKKFLPSRKTKELKNHGRRNSAQPWHQTIVGQKPPNRSHKIGIKIGAKKLLP